jgi:hypothetical protein
LEILAPLLIVHEIAPMETGFNSKSWLEEQVTNGDEEGSKKLG